ncbi:hypothetical protein SDC9_209277 [bioreactor metagenome]|uniref:Uncharacterized protein n=1 Tax=bioreactor metagenome TaxID=1076179 RepID=A0A645JFU2_9ZZZZ
MEMTVILFLFLSDGNFHTAFIGIAVGVIACVGDGDLSGKSRCRHKVHIGQIGDRAVVIGGVGENHRIVITLCPVIGIQLSVGYVGQGKLHGRQSLAG